MKISRFNVQNLLKVFKSKEYQIFEVGVICRSQFGMLADSKLALKLCDRKKIKGLTIKRMVPELCSRLGEGGEGFYKIQLGHSVMITPTVTR